MTNDRRGERTASGRPRLPGLSELTLTEQEARELERLLDQPPPRPVQAPQTVPVRDESVLREAGR